MVALAALVALGLLTAVRTAPPEVVPASAPATEFSAERAHALAARILGDQTPHPVGSPENAAVRERLLTEIRALGLEPQVHDTFQVATRYGTGAQVQNVLARLKGTGDEPAILLMSHYDSREAAPGAGDDMAGCVAILETVRALQAGPPLKRDVIALFTDGEESGLVGADAFIHQHPWFADVGVVLNLEGRGNSGASLMFETGPQNGDLVRRWASASPRPIGGSTFSTIYRYLPNNTDFTPFIAQGENGPALQGLNFAFIGNVAHYHTSEDNLENLDLRSVQHHGEHMLGLTRDLADGPPLEPDGDAVYFDVFAAFVIGWPEGATLPLALLTLALVLAPFVMLRRRPRGKHLVDPERVRWSELGWGLLAVFLTLLIGIGAALGIGWLLGGDLPFVASPAPRVAFYACSALVTVVGVGLILHRCTLWGTLTATYLVWAIAGLIWALTLPGISYLFLVPPLSYGAVATLLVRMRQEGCTGCAGIVVLAPLLASACLYLPTVTLLLDGMGIGLQSPTGIVMVLFATTALPLFARREVLVPIAMLGALLLATLVIGVVALTSEPYSPEKPRRLIVLQHMDADSGTSRYMLMTPSATLPDIAQGHGFSQTKQWIPGVPVSAFVAKAPPFEAKPPRLEGLTSEPIEGGRRVRFTLKSQRGAYQAAVFLPADALLRGTGESISTRAARAPRGDTGVLLQGQPLPRLRNQGGTVVLWCHALPPGGLKVELSLKGNAPVRAMAIDTRPGLPGAGASMATTIRGDAAVPTHLGDQTFVSTNVDL